MLEYINQRLRSFYWLKVAKKEEQMKQVYKENDVELFLDSGAFSAFTQGITIDLDEYMAFIRKYASMISVYANLDVIGDPEATLKNQKRMEKAGLHPLPCFHYGESEKYLQFYLDNYDYIALGGMAANSKGMALRTEDRASWLDYVFGRFICATDSGMPRCKVHGYGMTALPLMKRYPWYSVDSTSWVNNSRLGSIYIPKRDGKKWDYLTDAYKVDVSYRSPSRKKQGEHYLTIPAGTRTIVDDFIRELGFKMGKSHFVMKEAKYEPDEKRERWNGKELNGKRELEIIEEYGLGNDYRTRDEINIRYFLLLEKALPKWPWPFRVKKTRGLGIVR